MADTDVDKIKERLSIHEVVGQCVELKRAGKNFRARCPFHTERTPSFFVSPERGTYMCFGCGEKGDIFSFVERMEGIDFGAALRQLAQKAGVTLSQGRVPKKDTEHEDRLRDVCEEATKFFEGELKAHPEARKYLAARGIEEETVVLWRLGYAPARWRELSEHLVQKGFSKDDIVESGLAIRSQKLGEVYDRFRGRVMFPLNDSAGRVIAFSGRFFEKVPGSSEEGEPAKYVNSPETALFKKSKILYGFDRAKTAIRRWDCVLLVEGQLDLIAAHQSGLPFAVALSGTALTPEHLRLLSRLSKRLVLALDADRAGVRSGLRSTRMALAEGFEIKVPTFPPGQDPADLAKENPELLKAAVRTSRPAIEFFLDVLTAQAKDGRGYIKLVQAEVLPLIAAVDNKIEEEHLVRVVAGRIGVSEAAVMAELAKVAVVERLDDEEIDATKKPALPALSPLEQKIGTLVVYFGMDSEVGRRVKELAGEERVREVEQALPLYGEFLKFTFEREAEEGAGETTVVSDMLTDIERMTVKEDFKKAGEDTKRIQELAKRSQELRK